MRRLAIMLMRAALYFAFFLAALIVLTKLAGYLWPARADEYPPGLFERSPEIGGDGKRWTHTPDGRWMFVDPAKPKQDCDFQNHCYPDAESTPSPSPAEPQGQAPKIPNAIMPAEPPAGLSETPEAGAMPPGAFGMAGPPTTDYRDYGQPPPAAFDPACAELRHRLFRNLWEVYQARKRCGP